MDESFVDRFVEILYERGLLKKNDVKGLKEAFAHRGDLTFEEFLLDENIIDRAQLLLALGEYYGTAGVDVVGLFFDHNLVRQFPRDVLMRYNFIPWMVDENILLVIAAHPDNSELPEIIGKYLWYDVTFMVGYFRDIRDAIIEFYDEALTQDIIMKEQSQGREEEWQDANIEDLLDRYAHGPNDSRHYENEANQQEPIHQKK